MLTGVQLLQQGEVTLAKSSSSSTGGGFTVPIPEPVAGTARAVAGGGGAVTIKGDIRGKSESGSVYGHADARVWAAQFMRLKIKLANEVPHEGSQVTSRKWIKFRELVDLGTEGIWSDEEDDIGVEYAELNDIALSVSDSELRMEITENTLEVDWNLVDEYLDYVAAVPQE
jgi:hypothetical protein